MELQVIFRDYQEIPAEDLLNLESFVRTSFDDLVKYSIAPGQKYGGFDVAKTTGYGVAIAPGIYANTGAIYARPTVTTQDLSSFQPVAASRIVAVVTFGQEVETDVKTRDFLVNVETETVEAQQVAMTRARVAQLGFLSGMESGDPQLPTIPADKLLVATITLTTTGITSIQMVEDNRLGTVDNNRQRVASLEVWRALTEPRVATIGSDLAGLANSVRGMAGSDALYRIAADVARLKDLSNLPSDYADYGADEFLDMSQSDTADLEYLAKVEEGIRFSDANANLSALGVFNSLNPAVNISSGLLLPAFSSVKRLDVTGYAGELSIAQYTTHTTTFEQKTMSVSRIRWGGVYTVCTNSAWWQSGYYNPVSNIFYRAGQTYVLQAGRPYVNHTMVRLQQFWVDTWAEPYWDAVTIEHVVNGSQIAQSFLCTQDGWLTGIDLSFTRRGASGDVNLTLCELTPSGTPDPSNAILHQVIPVGSLALHPAITTVSTVPTFLGSGKRYAIVLTTTGNHYVALADGNNYASGTLFNSTDSVYYQGDLTKDLMFGLRFAQFSNSRTVVDMQPLNLDGGIAAIDILAGMVIPQSCQLTFQVQINNVWVPLDAVSQNSLAGLPPLLPLQAVFQGTPDIQAGVRLTDSSVQLSRPRTSLTHISTAQSRQSTSTVRVQWTLGNWNSERHAFSAVLTGVFGTESADITVDEDLGNGRLRRTMTFNTTAPVNSYKIKCSGTTTTALDAFFVEERVDVTF